MDWTLIALWCLATMPAEAPAETDSATFRGLDSLAVLAKAFVLPVCGGIVWDLRLAVAQPVVLLRDRKKYPGTIHTVDTCRGRSLPTAVLFPKPRATLCSVH